MTATCLLHNTTQEREKIDSVSWASIREYKTKVIRKHDGMTYECECKNMAYSPSHKAPCGTPVCKHLIWLIEVIQYIVEMNKEN